MPSPRLLAYLTVATTLELCAPRAWAQHPDGAGLVRLLGTRARAAFAPAAAPGMGAVVRLASGVHAADLGLRELTPGYARFWGTPEQLVSFGDAHPGLPIEVAPPLHPLLDTATRFIASTAANDAGHLGDNALVGIADTGIDVTHPDFLDASGGTRVAWLLDLSAPPIGKHPDLEQQFGSAGADGTIALGAVWSKADLDAVLAGGATSTLPHDEIGHGTLVAACAAANDKVYSGVAPHAGLLIARISEDASGSIGNDELLRGVAFLFDRADFMGKPVAVNLSIGTDFGPHDGSMAWEETLAGYVGAAHPGHALVAAAGNSGSIVPPLIHQNVHSTTGATLRVPVTTGGADNGSVQVWVSMHGSAQLGVGLDGPDGTWIAPVGSGKSAGKNTSDYTAAVYNGSAASGSPVPAMSQGAVVLWQGKWPQGTYWVTLTGSGTADLYLQAIGDASIAGTRDAGFADGVRESTINLPATQPAIIGVGCTINKRSWVTSNRLALGLEVPSLDSAGGEYDPSLDGNEPADGEPCWFSSAGPTVTGVPKPEIMAPGAAIVGALSEQALPPGPASIFTNPDCPSTGGTVNENCQVIDSQHGVSFGTSFSAPLVAGAAALLLDHDPTLTQDSILAALQSGAHALRGTARFNDQVGAGELDVMGALEAADLLREPVTALPVRASSWMTPGADVCLADGSTALPAIVELRAAAPAGTTPGPADGFDHSRLAAYALVDGALFGALPIVRRSPGVWTVSVLLPAGHGGSRLTVGVTFDGADVVTPKTVPIATDMWNAEYPASARGGCVAAPGRAGSGGATRGFAGLLGVVFLAFRRRTAGLVAGRGRAITGPSAAGAGKESWAPARARSRRSGPRRA